MLEKFYRYIPSPHSQTVLIVRDSARIKYELMGFMVYFSPAENKHLLLHDIFVHGKRPKEDV
jgi:hypothetical protein